MLIVVVALATVVSVPLLGGSYAALAHLRLRGTWLVAGALVIQIVIISVFDFDVEAVSRSLHVATYLMIGVCLALNRAVRRMWLVSVGWLCNFTAIGVNGGVMPASTSAAAALGRSVSGTFANSVPSSHARLAFLGDILPIPRRLPLANILSIGDVLLLAGLVLVVFCASRVPNRQPALVLVPRPGTFARFVGQERLGLRFSSSKMRKAFLRRRALPVTLLIRPKPGKRFRARY